MTVGLTVRVDYGAVRANAARIRSLVGGRLVYGVVKADGYGLGAREVARAIAGNVDGYYCFSPLEAVQADLKSLGKRVIALDHPGMGWSAEEYRAVGVVPIVTSAERYRALASVAPVLSIDTGMQRFGCSAEEAAELLASERAGGAGGGGGLAEVMTHGVRAEQVEMLLALLGEHRARLKVHAAGTKLMEEGAAYYLDGVRPGLALYRGAMRVSGRVVEARDVRPGAKGGTGKAGYGQFEARRVGVILGGYTSGLRAGVCMVRGERRRLYESGMQSSYVELKAGEGVGEEVVLLGEGLTEAEVRKAWGISEQEVLVRLSAGGTRTSATGLDFAGCGPEGLTRNSGAMQPAMPGGSHEGTFVQQGMGQSLASSDLRRLRHDIRGCMHGLQLVISALETPLTAADAAEFLGDVEKAADRMDVLISQLERMPEP